MEEWSYFYPMVLRRRELEREDPDQAFDLHSHVAVEVIVGKAPLRSGPRPPRRGDFDPRILVTGSLAV